MQIAANACALELIRDKFLIIHQNLIILYQNFRRLLFFFNKLSLEKKFIRKVERLNVSVDPDETAYMSCLIWIYAVCKNLLISPVAVKELMRCH